MQTTIAPTVQSFSQLDERMQAYVLRCRERAVAANLAVVRMTLANGHVGVFVRSQTRDMWHRVIRRGNRYICDCEAMAPDKGKLPACIHTQTVWAIRAGKLTAHGL